MANDSTTTPLEAGITTNATKPSSVASDGVSATAIPIVSQIEADKYLAANSARRNSPSFGLSFRKLKPPGGD